jgi:hypothetical protein
MKPFRVRDGTKNDEASLERFNKTFLVSGSALAIWFAMREQVLGLPTGLSVLVEWVGLLLVAAIIVITGRYSTQKGNLGAIALSVATLLYLIVSSWQLADLGQWSMYWSGFGIEISVAAIIAATTLILVVPKIDSLRSFIFFRLLRQGTRAAGWPLGFAAVLWMTPSLLQPMDAWLNIGDASEKVLDEITGPLVGNFPGVNQASGYSSLLGIPLLPLAAFRGYGEGKFTLLVLYVNILIIAVPLLIALILRRSFQRLPLLLAVIIGLVSVTISGSPVGNDASRFNLNSSLFRELSFLSRGLLPLVVGYLVVITFDRARVSSIRLVFLAVVSALAIINNPEFGIASAIAALAAALFWRLGTGNRDSNFYLIVPIIFVTVVCFLVPGIAVGGDWINRRLGAFASLAAGEGATLSSGSMRDTPAMGLLVVCYSLSITAVAVALNEIRRGGFEKSRSAVLICLYFGAWVLLSAPYFLNAGGVGQFLMIPFSILSVALLRLVVFSGDKEKLEGQFSSLPSLSGVRQRLSALPIVFLFSLSVVTVLSAPNGVKEWQRIQMPVSDLKWVDEWSTRRLDYLTIDGVKALANTTGDSSQVGWWFQHGNAIELLTGIENLFGTSGFEGALKSRTSKDLACEPVIKSQLRFIITHSRYVSVLASCDGIRIIKSSLADGEGLILVTLDR